MFKTTGITFGVLAVMYGLIFIAGLTSLLDTLYQRAGDIILWAVILIDFCIWVAAAAFGISALKAKRRAVGVCAVIIGVVMFANFLLIWGVNLLV